jgi:hypothetical protein
MLEIIPLYVIPVDVVGAAILLGEQPGTAADSVPEKLTVDSFDVIKARITPTPQDLAWQQVRWRDGFFQGLLEAQAADKPIFYWIYEGDPRGGC